jgi:5-methyltetrahydrofolate--homocysteine methyltransferase
MGSDLDSLVQSLTDGDRERSLELTARLLAEGARPLDLVTLGVERAMAALDRKCTAEQFNLLEIMLAGRAVMAVIRRLFPGDAALPDPRASVVLAVLEGDIHDIGKAIVKVLLVGSRYRVIDCGKDASTAAVVAAAAESGAAAVCVSGLISSVIPQVRSLRPELLRAGLPHVRVLAGGAALKQCTASDLNVDHVGQSAFDAIAYLDALVEAGRARC